MDIFYQAFHHDDMKDVTYDALSNRQVDEVQHTQYIFQYHLPLVCILSASFQIEFYQNADIQIQDYVDSSSQTALVLEKRDAVLCASDGNF